MDLSKQQTLDINSKLIQQINFRGNLYRTGNPTLFIFLKTQQKNYFGFLLLEFYCFIFILFHFIISFIIQH